jgi:hypothetical protein
MVLESNSDTRRTNQPNEYYGWQPPIALLGVKKNVQQEISRNLI